MTSLVKSFRHVFKASYHAFSSFVDVDLYLTPAEIHDNHFVVVIKDPLDEDSGLSVTNGIELIISNLIQQMPELRSPETVWIEHYPARSGVGKSRGLREKPTWDRVTFELRDQESPYERKLVQKIQWYHLTEEQFRELLG